MIVLGVETSCDETGVGIVELADDGTVTILADTVASSMAEHARFGGVVPEIASRAHLEQMGPVMRAALAEAGVEKPDAVAATVGPGLAGALLVGASAAKAYAAAWDVPFYGVNHLGGHVAVANLEGETLPHSVALLVSGGHTQLLHVRSLTEPVVELGSTVDDAAGEAYDKVARLLGLGYPGGPVIDRLAMSGDPEAIPFPRAMRDEGYDWSKRLPGATSKTLWTGYLPYGRLPRVKNPASGFVQNCNNTPFRATTTANMLAASRLKKNHEGPMAEGR